MLLRRTSEDELRRRWQYEQLLAKAERLMDFALLWLQAKGLQAPQQDSGLAGLLSGVASLAKNNAPVPPKPQS